MTQDRYANPPSERNDRTQVLGSDRHLRSDCRMVKKMLTLGVIPEEQMENIIKRAGNLLVKENDTKQFAQLFGVLVQAAKLERQANNSKPKEVHHSHEHSGTVTITDEQRTAIARAGELVAEAERRGLIVDGRVVDPARPLVEVHSAQTDAQAARVSGS